MELHPLIWWLAGLVPGLALGWWLRARGAAKPPIRQIADAPVPQPPQPPQPASEPKPQPVVAPAPPAAVSAPAAPAPAAPRVEPAPAAQAQPNPAQAAPAPPAWPEAVQELFDNGQTVDALVLIRRTLGAPLARKAAREQFADGGYAPLPAPVRKLADEGKKLDAIRQLCELTHMDLPLAQRLVEHYVAHPGR